MKFFSVRPARFLKGSVRVPGDKSIAHRACILSALAEGETIINNYPLNDDCLATVEVFRRLGIKIKVTSKGEVTVFGKGLFGLQKPQGPIFISESGTTFRLMLGVLAGQNFNSQISAGRALSKRPMLRVTGALRKMNACINGIVRDKDEYPPINIKGSKLRAIKFRSPVASAQVKSAVLLAGLYAQGLTTVIEKTATRDHTERMLRKFGYQLKIRAKQISLYGRGKLVSPGRLLIPGDISSAAFFLVGASIIRGSKVTVKDVSLNPGRIGLLLVLKRMGAKLSIEHKRFLKDEPVGDLRVSFSRLKGVTITKTEIPSLIDELPILMVAACFAKGKTVFKGVGELRFKETDRINSMISNLREIGADIRLAKTGNSENILVQGQGFLTGGSVKSFCDHRTAMSMVIAGAASRQGIRIDDLSCINKSFPAFMRILESLKKN